MQQFNAFYYKRLEQLRPAVQDAARLKWEDKYDSIDILDNILDLKTNIRTVIIGTLFKEQKKKPSVMHYLCGVIKSVNPMLLSIGADEEMYQKQWDGYFVSNDD